MYSDHIPSPGMTCFLWKVTSKWNQAGTSQRTPAEGTVVLEKYSTAILPGTSATIPQGCLSYHQ